MFPVIHPQAAHPSMSNSKPIDIEKSILIVEDSTSFGTMLQQRIESQLGVKAIWAASYQACQAILEREDQAFAVALLDVNLPDAPRGEVIDLVLSRRIPAIVFTGVLDDTLRNSFWSRHIVDYVLKQSAASIDYAMTALRRILCNKDLKCLVVDDSKLYRKTMANLLRSQGYRVLEAQSGQEALDSLAANPDTKLVLADYTMPDMNGVELTRRIRKKTSLDQLAIIGISNTDNTETSVLFLKNGANDYIKKPFQTEEFYCRISLNIDTIQQFDTIRRLAYTDYLTKVSNRRHLFESGEAAAARAVASNAPLTVAMLDIDHFKRINDAYGHDAGDAVLVHLADRLCRAFGQEALVGRIGGEEFCVVCPGLALEETKPRFEALRAELAEAVVETQGQRLRYTVSIGLHDGPAPSFEARLKAADRRLYEAKTAGRNLVMA